MVAVQNLLRHHQYLNHFHQMPLQPSTLHPARPSHGLGRRLRVSSPVTFALHTRSRYSQMHRLRYP